MFQHEGDQSAYRSVDITHLAILSEQFPPRLLQLGFRLMQAVDADGQDRYRYILPPVCEVPAGPFLMGSTSQHDPDATVDEMPQSVIVVSAFQIGVYPVTVAEYACAIQVGAVSVPDDFFDFSWQDQRDYPERPIICISLKQARDYIKWMTSVTGQPWRMPTEAEWEKAARGTDGRIYPWGDDWEAMRANINAPAMIPVGSYPQGASSYGVQDMISNVWEWTSSLYRPYPYQREVAEDNADTTSQRALRGGFWDYEPLNARIACRIRGELDSFGLLGMRLALSGGAGSGEP